jgi:hypothetical protein
MNFLSDIESRALELGDARAFRPVRLWLAVDCYRDLADAALRLGEGLQAQGLLPPSKSHGEDTSGAERAAKNGNRTSGAGDLRWISGRKRYRSVPSCSALRAIGWQAGFQSGA